MGWNRSLQPDVLSVGSVGSINHSSVEPSKAIEPVPSPTGEYKTLSRLVIICSL